MTYSDTCKLIVGFMLAFALWAVGKCSAYDRFDCAWLANTTYTAVVMHQQYQMPRENYHVAWADEGSDWAFYGEAEISNAFKWEGDPVAFAEAVFGRCSQEET